MSDCPRRASQTDERRRQRVRLNMRRTQIVCRPVQGAIDEQQHVCSVGHVDVFYIELSDFETPSEDVAAAAHWLQTSSRGACATMQQ